MADEIADNAGALGLGVTLDGGADIACRIAGHCRSEARFEAFVGDFDQPLGLA